MPRGAVSLELRDVVAPAGGGVWVVGAWTGTTTNSLFAHFDGTNWTVIPVPGIGVAAEQYDLTSIDATGDGDIWAVGSIRSSGLTGSTAAALRYNGRWSVTPTPSTPGTISVLNGIDMLSADDGWAVGQTTTSTGPARAMILRWQTSRWVPVALPDTGAIRSELISVRALSGTDVWAVGSQMFADGRLMGLVLHWDGVGWRHLPVPDSGAEDQTLLGVDVAPAAQVWVVGRSCQEFWPSQLCTSRVLRSDGGKWDVIPTAGNATQLTDVIAFSLTDVWVFGYANNVLGSETHHVEHWDGTRFDSDTGSAYGMGVQDSEPASALAAASAASPQELWAVGWSNGGTGLVSHTIRRQ